MKENVARAVKRAASTSTLSKEAGDISSVFPSLSGKKPDPLPPRFATLKRQLIQGHEDTVKASWHRLLADLNDEIDEIKSEGTNIIPTVSYHHVEKGTVPKSFIDSLRHRGVGIIRNVINHTLARDLKSKVETYISANRPNIRAFPPDNPAVYELYWSPSQILARNHPNLLRTQTFLSSLWHSSDPTSTISTAYPLTYADRLRIRTPGDAKFALGPHIDGGSLERWEDATYRQCYGSILRGNWEEHDPYDAAHRIDAQMDLYNGAGACSMFRLFQGWLALSSTGPGEGSLRVCPLLKHATAYWMLRPFFDPATQDLDLESSDFPGSVPGAGQEFAVSTHPCLRLEESMLSIPRVEPGDYVAWHCDAIHAVDGVHRGRGDSAVLYVPACALTERNARFVGRQRDCALRYEPPPDFPGAGGGGGGEGGFKGRVVWPGVGGRANRPDAGDGGREDRWSEVSGDEEKSDGWRAMGMGTKKWEVQEGMNEGERRAVEIGNKILFDAE